MTGPGRRGGEVLALAADERADFADFLETLTPSQWQAPSLCADWTVRDVVAHVISYDELSWWETTKRFARGRFVPGRINQLGVAEYAREPRELIALLRAHQRPSGLPAGFGGMIALVDGMIHHQDIRRPLGLPRDIPRDRLRTTLRLALLAPPIRAFVRARGLTLVATDLDWSRGSGPEVRGPAEALLMAIAGRAGALDELSGPGLPLLAARV
ncbi:maleylpyruvate isomerase family mycothiol-dependent enzyme [Amycolatopsis aidingensis]|uniref:maleylpyruvate isomerase family mycothiol-dependent enzyme n=1 Tax=Amycolatopsis aidingensis TaxID=2842453 RepID=UPI001C0CD020|nr:maleylpyruvate isomerase family mycothiol-dependent enzyme [Amycolatopsis aidingensis]